MMCIRRSVTSLILAALMLALVPRALAAPPRQDIKGTLYYDDQAPASGTLDATTSAHTYLFQCAENVQASLVAETTSGDLATELTVDLGDGSPATYGPLTPATAPPATVAEGLIMPNSGRCQVTVSRVGDTSGSYDLFLRHGFGRLAVLDPFDGTSSPLTLEWGSYTSDTMQAELGIGRFEMQILTDNLLGYYIPEGDAPEFSDLYAQVDVQVAGAPSYFEYGLALRLTSDSEKDNFYVIEFSQDDDFTVYYFSGGEWTPIQEWTVSPAISASSAPRARIGMSLAGDTFRLYFNDQFVAEVQDPNLYATKGTIALAAATGQDQTDTVTAYFDNLMITVPYQAGSGLPFGGQGTSAVPTETPSGLSGLAQILGGNRTPTAAAPQPTPTSPFVLPAATPEANLPASISVGPSDTPEAAIEQLQQAGVVPAGGRLALKVPTSYGDTSGANWSNYPLGQGQTFRNFVLSFTARLVATGPGSGCGMYFREADGVTESAFVFEDGYALLGEWTPEGSLTDASVLQQIDAVEPGQGVFNHVLVIAQDESVTMYVNGELFATAQFEAKDGGVALEMYVQPDEAGNTQQTYCQLNNIWLWEF